MFQEKTAGKPPSIIFLQSLIGAEISTFLILENQVVAKASLGPIPPLFLINTIAKVMILLMQK